MAVTARASHVAEHLSRYRIKGRWGIKRGGIDRDDGTTIPLVRVYTHKYILYIYNIWLRGIARYKQDARGLANPCGTRHYYIPTDIDRYNNEN